MLALQLVVILGGVILACGIAAPRIGVGAPILLLLSGIALGFVDILRSVHFPPELMLLVFLPMLLYWEAFTTSLREVRAALRGIVLTGTLLVVVTAAAVAATAHALGMDWGPAWVLGAALAPTDATAVGALARSLPRRDASMLRAESLINDGTALVLYAVAVEVTVDGHELSVAETGWSFVVSYVGGVAVGAVLAWLGYQARARIADPKLNTVLILLVPFTAYLAAEEIHASGVLAVVVTGLVMSRVVPRVTSPAARRQANAFWTLATYLLNAALFVLVGIEANASVRSLTSTDIVDGVLTVAAVYAAVLAVRFLFLVVTAYTVRLLDRRPSQLRRRMTNRARAVLTMAGFRGAVSLAVALSVPTTVASGAPFPGRDVIIFVTAGVVLATTVIQGLLFGPTVRWARLPDDDGAVRERLQAEEAATRSALDALPEIAERLGTQQEMVDRLRGEYEEHLQSLEQREHAPHDPHAAHGDDYTALRLAGLAVKRQTIIRLRDEQEINDATLREIQTRLDDEELRLAP